MYIDFNVLNFTRFAESLWSLLYGSQKVKTYFAGLCYPPSDLDTFSPLVYQKIQGARTKISTTRYPLLLYVVAKISQQVNPMLIDKVWYVPYIYLVDKSQLNFTELL